jgi:hypothetical protein
MPEALPQGDSHTGARIENRDPSVVLGFDNALATLVFRRLLLSRGAFHVRHMTWPTTAHTLASTQRVICSSSNREAVGEDSWVFELDDVVVRLFLSRDRVVAATVAARSPQDLEAAERYLLDLMPRDTSEGRDDASGVTVTFWADGGSQPWSTRRTISVPSWREVSRNYSAVTRDLLGPLMSKSEWGDDGQLILWHGRPGTGKTFALRALASAWRSWCDVHYVVDPEAFFGGHPSYMLDALMNDGAWDEYAFTDSARPQADSAEDRWRLLTFEDTGELLGVDAKASTGQALSRLLNVVDGFLGQGLRLLILITTNEPLAAIHPAVGRPGRCAATVEFTPLTAKESTDWLRAKGTTPNADRSVTIADLYASLSGHLSATPYRQVGFA